jgi:hypothetical protein
VKLTNGRRIGHNCDSPRRETSMEWLRGREGVVLLSPAAQLRGVEVKVVVSSGVRLACRRQRWLRRVTWRPAMPEQLLLPS